MNRDEIKARNALRDPMKKGEKGKSKIPKRWVAVSAISGPLRGKQIFKPAIPNRLLAKIAALPADRIAEVERFVDSVIGLRERRAFVRDAMTLSEPAFAAVWDNPDDAAYDSL